MTLEFCYSCGKVLSAHEHGMFDCEVCYYTDPEPEIDAEYLDELEELELQSEYNW